MAWKIVKKSEKQYLIQDEGMTKGDVVNLQNDVWQVNFMMIAELAYVASTRERAIGYIRGVENTVNIYAKETGRNKKQA